MIDKGRADHGRRGPEVPVGFKWFVPGLRSGEVRLRRRGVRRGVLQPQGRHVVDDRQGRHPAGTAGQRDHRGHRQDPQPTLRRVHRAVRHHPLRPHRRSCHREQKAKLAALSADQVSATSLAGDPITAGSHRSSRQRRPHRRAQGDDGPNAWFAARPSGTEDVYKIYAESFKGPDHLAEVQAEAREVVSAALA
jgi:phosphoglucomutase